MGLKAQRAICRRDGDRPIGDLAVLKKFLAAKTAAVTTVLALGVVAAGATAGVMDGPADPALDDVTTTIPDETTTSVPDDTTTSVPEETTTTSVPEETTTTSVPEETTTTTAPEAPAPLTFERGPDPTGPARHGLCRAFGHRSEGPGGSVAAENLRTAAAHSGQSVEQFCADVLGGGEDEAPEAEDRVAEERTGRPDHAGRGNGHGSSKGGGNGKGRGRG